MESIEHEMQQANWTRLMRHIFLLLMVLIGACSREADDPLTEADGMTATKPYGSWPSPITAASVVEGSRGLSSLSFDSDYLYWVESRPEEGGRNTIMRWTAGASYYGVSDLEALNSPDGSH